MKFKNTLLAGLIFYTLASPFYPPSTSSASQPLFVETAFSPSLEAIELIENSINQAEKTINVAAYSFSSDKIATALIKAHRKGVKVMVVLDKTHSKKPYPAVVRMLEAGVPIRINRKYAIMHNKYIITDERDVETGSFNYTANAEKRNAENVIVIRNNPELAQNYLGNWKKLWNEAEEY